ncbi:POT family-domain-containing protein [Xylaria arbuscula]|nr:POT family-domain-containing protein [Xylaria arbuscula]
MEKSTVSTDVPASGASTAIGSDAKSAVNPRLASSPKDVVLNDQENAEAENLSDSGRPATEYEIKTLRHVTDGIPLRVWLVALISAAERFTYWSTQATWQNYIQHSPGDQIRGALGLGQAAGLTINSAFNVVIYILPIFIGPIADGRLGRYRTLQICTCFYLAGMFVLLGTSTPVAMRSGASLPGFIVALLLASIGLGGVQAVTTPLIADQYDETVARIAYKKNGEQVVIDRDMTIHYIYSIYYWLANAASLGAIPSTLLEKYFSFWSAYILTTSVLSLSVLVLWFGKPYFILSPPSGTVLPQAAQVIWIGATSKFNLDAALPENQLECGKQVAWNASFVKDIRQALMAVKICLAWPVLRLCVGVASSLSVVQAGQMQTIGIPNDLLTAFNSLALVIVGLAVETWLYPFLEKRWIRFFVMKRITLGLLFMALSMAYAALVQGLVYNAPPCYNFPLKCHGPDGSIITAPNRVNVLVQLPLYVLVAVSEVFAFVTGSAYTYQKAPHNMKSILQSFYAFMSGIGYLLAVAISPAAKDPNLVIIWSLVAGLTGATTIIFYACFRHYDNVDTSRQEG